MPGFIGSPGEVLTSRRDCEAKGGELRPRVRERLPPLVRHFIAPPITVHTLPLIWGRRMVMQGRGGTTIQTLDVITLARIATCRF